MSKNLKDFYSLINQGLSPIPTPKHELISCLPPELEEPLMTAEEVEVLKEMPKVKD